MSKGCVWFSFGSDKTGPILAKALDFQAIKKTPKFEGFDVVVGWGCKPGTAYSNAALNKLITEGQIRIINHPDAVVANRDKLATLAKLRDAGVAVPGFLKFDPSESKVTRALVAAALDEGLLVYPLIALNEHHKGEPYFCFTKEDVEAVIRGNGGLAPGERRRYFRSYDYGTEWRIHVFRDAALYAQAKVPGDSPLEATTQHLMKQLDRKIARAKESGAKIPKLPSPGVVKFIIDAVARETLRSSSQLKKSVAMGWEYHDVPLEGVPAQVTSLAVDAVEAAELDMGGVSISLDEDGGARVLSITTAPGLSEEQVQRYAEEIKTFASSQAPEKKGKKEGKVEGKTAPPELRARLYQKMKNATAQGAKKALKSLEE